jgi:hypothetical protein
VLKNTSAVSHYFACSVQDTNCDTSLMFLCDNRWPSDVIGHNGHFTAALTRRHWEKWMRDVMNYRQRVKTKMKSLLATQRRRVGEADVQFHSFLTSATDESEWSTSRVGRFNPAKKKKPGTHWIGGWIGPTASLDGLAMPGFEPPDCPVRSVVTT